MNSPQYLPGTDQVLDLFKGEIPRAGGRMTDAYEDGRRLFLRSVFPEVEEVRPRDKMQGGLAVHVAGPRVAVHLYLFRQVCRNGAIMAHSVQTQEIERVSPLECPDMEGAVEGIMAKLREAVAAAATGAAFREAVDFVRASLIRQANPTRDLAPLLVHFPAAIAVQIMDQFAREADSSTFGLMNAVTAVARDTPDPDLRWRLEELGGGIPALVHPWLQPDGMAAVALRA